jgi:hypothetical protein
VNRRWLRERARLPSELKQAWHSALWSTTLGCLALACGSSSTLSTVPSASEASQSSRGAGEWPPPAAEADSSESIVVLSAPRSRHGAERVIRAFFDAIRRESLRDLELLLADGASISSGPGSSPEPIAKVWAARFTRLEYGAGVAQVPYREDELGVFTPDELRSLRSERHYELMPGAGELLAVVTPRDRLEPPGPRHFGRRIEFTLGSTPAGLRILRMFEDFRLP